MLWPGHGHACCPRRIWYVAHWPTACGPQLSPRCAHPLRWAHTRCRSAGAEGLSVEEQRRLVEQARQRADTAATEKAAAKLKALQVRCYDFCTLGKGEGSGALY